MGWHDEERNEEMGEVRSELRKIRILLRPSGLREASGMVKLTDKTRPSIIADVNGEKSQIAGLSTLIAGLRDAVNNQIPADVPQDVKDKINAIFAAAEENKTGLADALNAGTPVTGDPSANGDGGSPPVATGTAKK